MLSHFHLLLVLDSVGSTRSITPTDMDEGEDVSITCLRLNKKHCTVSVHGHYHCLCSVLVLGGEREEEDKEKKIHQLGDGESVDLD